jgi:hypothetical protein
MHATNLQKNNSVAKYCGMEITSSLINTYALVTKQKLPCRRIIAKIGFLLPPVVLASYVYTELHKLELEIGSIALKSLAMSISSEEFQTSCSLSGVPQTSSSLSSVPLTNACRK